MLCISMEGAFNAMHVHENEFCTPSNRLNKDKLDLEKTLEDGADASVGFESFDGQLASVTVVVVE